MGLFLDGDTAFPEPSNKTMTSSPKQRKLIFKPKLRAVRRYNTNNLVVMSFTNSNRFACFEQRPGTHKLLPTFATAPRQNEVALSGGPFQGHLPGKERGLTLWYANICHLTPKVPTLKITVSNSENPPHLLLFSETFLGPHDPDPPAPIQGFPFITQDRALCTKKGGGGLGIFYHPDLSVRTVPRFCFSGDTIEILMVNVKGVRGSSQNLFIALVYLAPDGNLEDGLQMLEDFVTRLDTSSVLAIGDFNVPAGSHCQIANFSAATGLAQLVRDPTHVKGRILDLVFSGDPGTTVAVAERISDHRLVKVKLPAMTLHDPPKSSKKFSGRLLTFPPGSGAS
jgi:hypothetical protein